MNVVPYPYFLFAAIHHLNRPRLFPSDLVAQSAEQRQVQSGGHGFDSHRGQKNFSLPRVVPRFPLLGLTPSGSFLGFTQHFNLHFRVSFLFHHLCSWCYAAQLSYVPLLSLRCDSPPKSSSWFSLRPRSSVARVTLDLVRRSWVRFPPRSK